MIRYLHNNIIDSSLEAAEAETSAVETAAVETAAAAVKTRGTIVFSILTTTWERDDAFEPSLSYVFE